VFLLYFVFVSWSFHTWGTLLLTGSVTLGYIKITKINFRSFVVIVLLSIGIGLVGYTPHHAGLNTMIVSVLSSFVVAYWCFLHNYFIRRDIIINLVDYSRKVLTIVLLAVVIGVIVVSICFKLSDKVTLLQDKFFDACKLFFVIFISGISIGNLFALYGTTNYCQDIDSK
jgi:hypothetical protein